MAVCWIESESGREAVLYCSTTMTAFGPVFEESVKGGYTAGEMVEWFLWWVEKYKHSDARRYPAEKLEEMKGWWYRFFEEVSKEDCYYLEIPMDVETVTVELEKREE